MKRRPDYCAYCGKPVPNDECLKSQATRLPGKPRIAWHSDCVGPDIDVVHKITNPPRDWPGAIAIIEARGHDRVRRFGSYRSIR